MATTTKAKAKKAPAKKKAQPKVKPASDAVKKRLADEFKDSWENYAVLFEDTRTARDDMRTKADKAQKAGVTQDELGAIAGVSRQHISNEISRFRNGG